MLFVYERQKVESGMKIFIMTDLEGATGVAGNFVDIFPGGRMHEPARKFLTGDVNSAIEGAIEGGADDIVVLDGHGPGFSVSLEGLNPRAKLITGRRVLELEGIDESYDLMFVIGSHSMAGTPKGILPHTIGEFHNVWLNGRRVGEVGLWAALAGHYGVAVGLVTGDLAAVRENEALLGRIMTVAVKEATSEFAAKCLHPQITRKLIKRAAKAAVIKANESRPFRPSVPIELRVEYVEVNRAERIAKRGGMTIIDGRTVACSGDNVLELYNALIM
jgi:D-amino peptidase